MTTTPDYFLSRATVARGICPGCGDTVPCITFGGKQLYECPPCEAADTARRKLIERRRRTVLQWEDVTPTDMRAPIDRSRLPRRIAAALDTDGQCGCALIAETGAGKTRVAYGLLRMAAMRGLTVFAISHAEYRAAVARQWDKADEGRSVELMKAAKFAQALLIDDIGKGANTETADEAFFDLLSHRRDNRMLTHWTCNGGSAWMAKRFGPDRGPAIIKRLSDLSSGHVFNMNNEERKAA